MPIWRKEFGYDDSLTTEDLTRFSGVLYQHIDKISLRRGPKKAQKEGARLGILTLAQLRWAAAERERKREEKERPSESDSQPLPSSHRATPGANDSELGPAGRHRATPRAMDNSEVVPAGRPPPPLPPPPVAETHGPPRQGGINALHHLDMQTSLPTLLSDRRGVERGGRQHEGERCDNDLNNSVVFSPTCNQVELGDPADHTNPPLPGVPRKPPKPTPTKNGHTLTKEKVYTGERREQFHTPAPSQINDSLLAPMSAYPEDGEITFVYRNWYPVDARDMAERLPDIHSNPEEWEKSVKAEIVELRLDTWEVRKLITMCCPPKTFPYQISEGLDWLQADGHPYQCMRPVPTQGNNPAGEVRNAPHEAAVQVMINQAKALVRGNIDLSLITNIKMRQGEDIGDFVHRFTTQFDRHSGFTKGLPEYASVRNQFLIDALRPHLRQAIIMHDPLWRVRTTEEITILARYYNDIVPEPKPLVKLRAVMLDDGQVTLHRTHNPKRSPSGDQRDPPAGNGPEGQSQGNNINTNTNRAQNNTHTITCFSCGKKWHTSNRCKQYNPKLPFKPANWRPIQAQQQQNPATQGPPTESGQVQVQS